MSLSSEKALQSEFNMPQVLYCQFCQKLCKSRNSLKQHEARCKENPHKKLSKGLENYNRKRACGEISSWNAGLTALTDSRVKKGQDTFNKNQAAGLHIKYGHPQTEEFKKARREDALKNNLGGFNMRRGILYNGIKLDSSYEVVLAEDLDKNNIKWSRCKRFPYHVENKLHYYTPDFYLLDYDIYLDPKNDFLIYNVNPSLGFSDIEKIQQVEKENNIKVIILDKEQLNWQSIKKLMENNKF